MGKDNGYPNELPQVIDVENVTSTPRSSITYDEMNDLTLTPANNNAESLGKTRSVCTEKTIATEKYDIECASVTMEQIHQVQSGVTIASIIELPDARSHFYDGIPNGGYGWVVAVAGFLVNFVMFGSASIWGVFSNAFAQTVLKDKATTVQLMSVGSVAIISLNLFAPVSPLLSRFGTRSTMLFGSVLMSLGLIIAGFSTEVWHLFLTQGILFGAGASIVYMSVVAVIPQWFTTRRGTAMGISSAGSGFGGLALSPMVSSLISQYGIAWTYRIVGLMSFGICVVASFMMRTRLPPGEAKLPSRSPIKLSTLKSANFIIWLFGVVISLTGYLIPLFYMPKYCTSHGIPSTQSSNIVGVACAMNAIGRLVLGYFADRIGRLNMYVIASVSSGLFCMLLWPFAKTYETMMAFAVLFGFTCGIYYALAPPITASVVGADDISSGLSILFIVSSIAGVGPTISSAIQQATPSQGYIGVQMFSGSVYLFGSLICILLKLKMTGSLFSNM
ncbi:MFS general substrate transporter [Backusella circina FSU 941]|nr:MFS general substrate transporter [Backusella circina FSU 941]